MVDESDDNTRNFRGTLPRMTTTTFSDVVLTTIKSEYGGVRHAAKRLARDAKTSFRTAENWLAGKCMPNIKSLGVLMGTCQPLADEVAKFLVELKEKKGGSDG